MSSRVRILAACVSEYDHLLHLRGPKTDALSVDWLFLSDELGLYSESQVDILKSPTSTELRTWLLDYCDTRSAPGDILVFYFSGHGAIVGAGEFAFCLRDARPQADGNGVLPLSVLSFGDVVDTLAAVDVNPVFIIDACYSGAAATGRELPPGSIMALMHDEVHRKVGASYAMLCACSDRSAALDDIDGGAFTETLTDLAEQGLPAFRREPKINLQQIYPELAAACARRPDLPAPRLYLGPGLPDFALCKNAAHAELKYAFAGYLADLVLAMWNGGKPRALTLAEIREHGAGAYGNHRKLSFAPWDLVEDGSSTKERRLTARGALFAQGKLNVPRNIRSKSSETTEPSEWEAAPGSDEVSISDLGR